MRRILSGGVAFIMLLSMTLVVTVTPVAASSQSQQNSSQFKHIFYIMMENHATNEIFGNTADAPYINWLTSKYGIATNYYGVTHPSLPNYLAAISGDFQGIWDDCAAGSTVTCAPEEFGPTSGYTNGQELLTQAQITSATNTPHWFGGANIVDQLEAHGMSWKAYMQTLPYTGYTGAAYPIINGTPISLYVQKHNPFDYFSDIRNSSSRMQKIVPFNQLNQDLNAHTVPNFVWISPDTCHDMHGIDPTSAQEIGIPSCGYPVSGLDHGAIQLGDAFLNSTVSTIMDSHAWTEKSAIVISWDEDDYAGYTGCCHSPQGVGGVTLGGANAPFIAITSQNAHHTVDTSTAYNHYSLLATIEQLWGFSCLDNACGFSRSQLMTKFF